jgi:hypothetical protein
MQYQFHVDKRPCAPRRATIQEAARDALDAGFAAPDNIGRIVLHEAAEIVTINKSPTVH